MSANKEAIKTMLQHIINDKQEEADAVMHDYFVSKARTVAGMGDTVQEEPQSDDNE